MKLSMVAILFSLCSLFLSSCEYEDNQYYYNDFNSKDAIIQFRSSNLKGT